MSCGKVHKGNSANILFNEIKSISNLAGTKCTTVFNFVFLLEGEET